MSKFLVETISVFRIRYVIDCDSLEHAEDEVTMGVEKEFGQRHTTESIISSREVTDEEIPVLFFEDAPYLEQWGPEKAFEYVHKIKY